MNTPGQDDLTLRALSNPRAAFELARATFRAEIAPATDAEARQTLQKIRMAATNLKPGMATMPVLIVMIALLQLQWLDWRYPALWAALSIAAWVPGWQAVVRLLSQPDGALEPFRTTRSVLWRTSLFASVYGSMGFWFWVPGDPLNHMTVTVILLGSSIAGAMTAAWLPLSFVQIAIYVGSAVILFVARGDDPVYHGLAGLAAFYALFVTGVVISLHAYSLRLLNLENHKDDLIEDLRRSNQVKSDFLANMSHELRTPMNAILGFSEIIKDEVMGPNHQPLYKSYAGDIHASGSHLLGLINEILDLSKIEAGKFELNEIEVDAFDVIEGTKRIISLRAAQKGVALINEVPQGLIVRGDPSAMRQMSLNLASNALKFTPAGGTIRCYLESYKGEFCIVTEDTGCGIHPGDIPRLFENFGQGRHDVANTEKGTGLGLPIVRGLARAHGGDVTIESELGKGTKVRVTMDPARVVRIPDSLRTEAA